MPVLHSSKLHTSALTKNSRGQIRPSSAYYDARTAIELHEDLRATMNRSRAHQSDLTHIANTSLHSMVSQDSIESLKKHTTNQYWDMEREVRLMGMRLQESDTIVDSMGKKNTLNQPENHSSADTVILLDGSAGRDTKSMHMALQDIRSTAAELYSKMNNHTAQAHLKTSTREIHEVCHSMNTDIMDSLVHMRRQTTQLLQINSDEENKYRRTLARMEEEEDKRKKEKRQNSRLRKACNTVSSGLAIGSMLSLSRGNRSSYRPLVHRGSSEVDLLTSTDDTFDYR